MPDMVPTLAVLAAVANGESRIHNVAHLRIKESDRLHVLALELSKLGVKVMELPDGLIIRGGTAHGGAIDSHDDHRIAMAFAILGLRVEGIEIHQAEAVAKSFPGFWDEFARLGAGGNG
jgi:3-phosphoshikimate 1-carboxyvinyltransferase